jgi:acyl-CoA synthetase (AMP-forming)/AMP-acid ligase II
MYGQTEATARIAYVPPELLAEKRGSIGIAIPRGVLSLAPVEGSELKQMLYRGPNVMLGYATGPQDLALGDVLQGVLVTGDLAEVDGDGFYRITGRLARFAKLFGRRVQLGDVETRVQQAMRLNSAAIEGDNALEVFVEKASPEQVTAIRADLAAFLAVPPVAIKVVALAQLPLTVSGKKNYPALRS